MSNKESIFSRAKLNSFSDGLEGYLNNIVYSQSFYSQLHLIEIVLRNKIDSIIVKRLGTSWLTDSKRLSTLFHDKTVEYINQEKIKIKKANILHDDIVAALPFGFWVSVFEINPKRSRLKISLNITEFKYVFNIPRSLLSTNQNKRLEIYKDLMQILSFRNRVFHYEKVNNHVQYKNIDKLLNKIVSLMDDSAGTISNAVESLENKLFLNLLKKLKLVDDLITTNPRLGVDKACRQTKVRVSVYKYYKDNLYKN